MSNLKNLIEGYFSFNELKNGAIALQGPHQVAPAQINTYPSVGSIKSSSDIFKEYKICL